MSPHRSVYALLTAVIGAIAACDDAPSATAPSPTEMPPAAALLTPFATAGSPLPGLTADELALFQRGSAVFQIEFAPENGLGPLFNAVGCAACHENPVVGGSGSNDPEEGGEDIETHASAFVGAVCDDRAAVGGQVVQQQVTAARGCPRHHRGARHSRRHGLRAPHHARRVRIWAPRRRS